MTFPSFILGCMIASILGCAFHFWRGGKLGKLLLFNIFAWVGFWVGHLLAQWMGWHFLQLGPLNLGIAILFTLLFLFLGNWLGQVQVEAR